MAYGKNIEYVAKLMMSLDVDQGDVNKAKKMGAELAKTVGEEFARGFKKFGDLINNALSEANIKPIPFDKILDISDVEGTFDRLGKEAKNMIKTLNGAGSGGINAGLRGGLLKDIKALNEAYERNKNASGERTGKKVRAGITNSIKKAFDYEASDTAIKIGNNLRAITNEYNRSTTIKDVYIKLNIDYSGKLINSFYINRATYTIKEYTSCYVHSHAPRLDKSNPTIFRTMCLGSGPIIRTINNLINNFNKDFWQLFCFELHKYLQTESISGGPYIRLENIGTNNSSNYYNYGL
jgi:hypothetical protein